MSSQSAPVHELVKRKSVTMEYFLETSHLDATTAEMLKKYDKDGDGSFSKDEVVAIVLDLREAMQSNKMLGASNKLFKRLSIAALFFCAILLSSIFGLSYAVAALTRNTDVQVDGLMLTRDGSAVIATDSSAIVVSIGPDNNGNYCLPTAELFELASAAEQGRNRKLEIGDYEGVEGRVHVTDISADGLDFYDDKICFWNAQRGSYSCAIFGGNNSTTPCTPTDASGVRKLTENRELSEDPCDCVCSGGSSDVCSKCQLSVALGLGFDCTAYWCDDCDGYGR